MKEIPSTGFAGFDEGLNAVFAVDPKEAQSIVKAADGDIEEILKKLDKRVARAAVALEDQNLFDRFASAYPEQLIPVLTEAREITRRIFGNIIRDPDERHDLDVASQTDETDQNYLENLDAISTILMTSEWRFNLEGGSVIPGLKLSISNPGDKLLLRAYLDWDDAIYLSYRLLQELLDDSKNFELILPQAREKTNLKELYGDRVAKRVSSMLNDLKVIRAKLCELGFSRNDFAPD